VKVKGNGCYRYRAIDRDGNLVDTLLSEKRDWQSAKAFFKPAIATVGHQPDRLTTAKHAAYRRAIRQMIGRKACQRTSPYRNHRIEQDQRGIQQRDYPMRGFGSLASAARFCAAFSELRPYFRSQSTLSKPPSLSEKRQTCHRRWQEL